MVTAIIGAACIAAGFIVTYIICRRIQKSDDDQAEKFDIPTLPPSKWRIRKENGAWIVSRRVWWLSFGYRDMVCDRDVRYADRYYYAAPTWEAALNYCRKREERGLRADHTT